MLFIALTATFITDKIGEPGGPIFEKKASAVRQWKPLPILHQLVWGKLQQFTVVQRRASRSRVQGGGADVSSSGAPLLLEDMPLSKEKQRTVARALINADPQKMHKES